MDSKKEFSMYRVKKIKDKTKLVPSDHFPLVIKFKKIFLQDGSRESKRATGILINWMVGKSF